jgi:MFS family permease
VLGYSPLEAGLAILPMALMLMAISPRAPKLARRLGVRVVGGVGLALMGVGFLVFTTLEPDSSYWRFGAGALVTGIGLALATAPATTSIVSSLPGHKQGIASAVNDLAREVGGALGIAVLGSILYSGYRSDVGPATDGLPGPAERAAEGSIAAATQDRSRGRGEWGRHWSSRPRRPSSTASRPRSSSARAFCSAPA